MKMTDDKLSQLLEIGIALTAERDINKRLDLILETAMKMTDSDGGSICSLEGDKLVFKHMKTVSKGVSYGGGGEKIELPPVPLSKENICAYVALTKEALRIDDVYESDLFDFSGPKRYDKLNGYRTKSMVAIPMLDMDNQVIGVMEMINAIDENGEIRSYTDEETRILMSVASQMAISIANMEVMREIVRQVWSFTEAMTEAIDARTPYNASHTRKVARYAALLVDYINMLHAAGMESHSFTKEHREQVIVAAYLHDIGKLIVPMEVMNKASRLEKYNGIIEARFNNIELLVEIDELKGYIGREDMIFWKERIEKARKLVQRVDNIGYIDEELMSEVNEVAAYEYNSQDKKITVPFFTDDEAECLHIRKGTLTEGERLIMESHVTMTERILNKVHANRMFTEIVRWASQHHECLNGQGYPRGITGEEIGIEARILAVADITDALLSSDRPYKRPLSKEKAFEIMDDMAAKGMIDVTIVGYMKECIE